MKKSKICEYKLTEYVIAFLSVFILFMLTWCLKLKNNMNAMHSCMIIAEACLFIYAFYLKKKENLDAKKLLSIIMYAGMIIGVGNMLGTHIFDKGYDQGSISSAAKGHFGYILNLIEGHLPRDNGEQYYQPPLFHFIASFFVRFGQMCTGGNDEDAMQFVQIVNGSVYCFLLIAVKNFIVDIKAEKKYFWVMLITAFHPSFMLMGLRGNNDMLATFFIVLCLTNTYKWYVKRDMKTIIVLAFSFGLGMMTKISVGTIAILTGIVMIYCLVKDFKQKQYKKIICQLAVFAVICLPLGMWYPIRNLVLFNQPLGYVQMLPTNIPIYKGDIAWYKRFFGFDIIDLLKKPFFYYPDGYSIPIQVIKTSMFAEVKYESNLFMCSILVLVNIITIITAVVSAVYVGVKGKNCDKKIRVGALAMWIIIMVSYVQFNVQYPHLCTADFRYIAITAPLGAVFMSEAICCTNNIKIKKIIKAVMLAFAICVASIYM